MKEEKRMETFLRRDAEDLKVIRLRVRKARENHDWKRRVRECLKEASGTDSLDSAHAF